MKISFSSLDPMMKTVRLLIILKTTVLESTWTISFSRFFRVNLEILLLSSFSNRSWFGFWVRAEELLKYLEYSLVPSESRRRIPFISQYIYMDQGFYLGLGWVGGFVSDGCRVGLWMEVVGLLCGGGCLVGL